MPDERQQQHDEGRVVYARTLSSAEADAAQNAESVGAGVARMARERVAPTLPVLVVSFLLLVAVIVALGWMSTTELRRVSDETQRAQEDQTKRVRFLLTLRDAMERLEFEARDRGTHLSRGGIVNPFEHKLDSAQSDARKQLAFFQRTPQSQTAEGRAFAESAEKFIQTTDDPEDYSI